MNDEVEQRKEQIGDSLRENLNKSIFYPRHHDDTWFDAVSVVTVPRYKTSGLSGDEWRFSYHVRLYRKGLLLYDRGFGSFDFAVGAIPYFMGSAGEHGQEEYRVHDYDEKMKVLASLCMNPGCTEVAVSEYRIKVQFCRFCGQPEKYQDLHEHRVKFCQRHLRRGDCGLEDADSNYEVVSGPGPDQAKGYHQDISESAFGGIIEVS